MELGYKEDGDIVTLTMTRDDFNNLLISLGTATGAAMRDRMDALSRSRLRLINRLMQGNPDFIPYEVPDEVPR